PPGFTISTEICRHVLAGHDAFPPDLESQVSDALDGIAAVAGHRFGDPDHPLLVSVRSGAAISMPGMMDTVLNLGLNDETVEGLAQVSGDRRFAFDSYRRFIQMYGDVVLGLDHSVFEEKLEDYKLERGYTLDTDLDADNWQSVCAAFKALVE